METKLYFEEGLNLKATNHYMSKLHGKPTIPVINYFYSTPTTLQYYIASDESKPTTFYMRGIRKNRGIRIDGELTDSHAVTLYFDGDTKVREYYLVDDFTIHGLVEDANFHVCFEGLSRART